MNGDGTIDFDEFMEMMKKQSEHQDNSAELKEAFKIFDRDGNGYIDASELKKVEESHLEIVMNSKLTLFKHILCSDQCIDFIIQMFL